MVRVRKHLRGKPNDMHVQLGVDAMGQPVLLPASPKPGLVRRMGGSVKRTGESVAKKMRGKPEQQNPELVRLAAQAEELASILSSMEAQDG